LSEYYLKTTILKETITFFIINWVHDCYFERKLF